MCLTVFDFFLSIFPYLHLNLYCCCGVQSPALELLSQPCQTQYIAFPQLSCLQWTQHAQLARAALLETSHLLQRAATGAVKVSRAHRPSHYNHYTERAWCRHAPLSPPSASFLQLWVFWCDLIHPLRFFQPINLRRNNPLIAHMPPRRDSTPCPLPSLRPPEVERALFWPEWVLHRHCATAVRSHQWSKEGLCHSYGHSPGITPPSSHAAMFAVGPLYIIIPDICKIRVMIFFFHKLKKLKGDEFEAPHHHHLQCKLLFSSL